MTVQLQVKFMSPNESLDPNLLQNMIRQRTVLNSLGNGGIPQSPMPQSPPSPDLTVHVNHFAGESPQSSITPQAQQAIAPEENNQTGVPPLPSSITSPEAPTPKIGPINPNDANPAESAYKQAIMNEPMHGDYHPSGMRKFLGVLGGIGAGIVAPGDKVQAGVQAGDAIRDAPFNSHHQDWAQYTGNKNALATAEAAGTATSGKQALTQAQIGEQNSLATLHGNESNSKIRELNLMPSTHDEAIADKVTEAQSRLKVDTREAKMADGTIKHLVQHNGLFYDPETVSSTNPLGTRIDRSAIEDISDEGKTLKETRASRIPGNLGASVQAKKIISAGVGGKTDDGTTVDQPTFDAAKEFDAKLQRGDDPKGAFDSIVTARNRERVAAGKSPMSSNELEALQTKLLSVTKPPAGTTMLVPTDTGYKPVLAKPGGPEIPKNAQTTSGVNQENTDTAPTRQMSETAPHVINLMDKIDKEIDENIKDLGPAAGRWQDYWTGKVGAPNAKFAKMQTDVALAKTLIMRMHLGSRGGQGMYEHFNKMLDLAGSAPENLHAATGAIRDYAADVAKGGHNQNAPIEEYVRDANGKLVLKGK